MILRPYVNSMMMNNKKILGQYDAIPPMPDVEISTDYGSTYFCSTTATISFTATTNAISPTFMWYNHGLYVGSGNPITITDSGFIVTCVVWDQMIVSGVTSPISILYRPTFHCFITDTSPDPDYPTEYTGSVDHSGSFNYNWYLYPGGYPDYGQHAYHIGSASVVHLAHPLYSGELNPGEPGYPGTWHDCLELVVTSVDGSAFCNTQNGGTYCA